jgi:adenosylcobinamide kinase / adenosylcobinamide-phosphate guanylyltransferase
VRTTLRPGLQVADEPPVTLILGGARSGKSAYAQDLAAAQSNPVLFVATGVAVDDEMAERIAVHRAARPASWQCVEAPTGVGKAIRDAPGAFAVALVDCLSFLVSNCLLAAGNASVELTERAVWPRIEDEVADMLAGARSRGAQLIVVSNEVGMSVVPEFPLGRVYRDVLGRANQRLAREAGAVYLMVAGIPAAIKPAGVTTPSPER